MLAFALHPRMRRLNGPRPVLIGVQSKGEGAGVAPLLLRGENVLLNAHNFGDRARATFPAVTDTQLSTGPSVVHRPAKRDWRGDRGEPGRWRYGRLTDTPGRRSNQRRQLDPRRFEPSIAQRKVILTEPSDTPWPVVGIVRAVRRLADQSQRELARWVGVHHGDRGPDRGGSGSRRASPLLRRISRWSVSGWPWSTSSAGCSPRCGTATTPATARSAATPSHLDTILDPEPGEWWADVYGLARPPETFYRNRAVRDVMRRRSQWEVRVAKHRNAPPPAQPSCGTREDGPPTRRVAGRRAVGVRDRQSSLVIVPVANGRPTAGRARRPPQRQLLVRLPLAVTAHRHRERHRRLPGGQHLAAGVRVEVRAHLRRQATVAAQSSTGWDSGRDTVAVKVSCRVPWSPSATAVSATVNDARDRNLATCGSWSLSPATRPRRTPPASRR